LCELLENGEWIPVVKKKRTEDHRKLDVLQESFSSMGLMEKKDYDVRVFCPQCKGGDNIIWKGGLIDWGLEMSGPANKPVPEWAQYAKRHEVTHGHTVMVEYPDRIVRLFNPLKRTIGGP
jgi:hypothetical protein